MSLLSDLINLDLSEVTEKSIVEYIWIGGSGMDLRSKARGVANRGASIRVGRGTEKEGKGYFEDRRPASNMDPYVVTSMIAETTLLWKP